MRQIDYQITRSSFVGPDNTERTELEVIKDLCSQVAKLAGQGYKLEGGLCTDGLTLFQAMALYDYD